MKIAFVSDAWSPQVNGVVTTAVELVRGLTARGHEVDVIEPSTFRRLPCPGYRELELAVWPGPQVSERLSLSRAQAIHIATEGPLGSAARRWCLRHGMPFTTAFHTRFPELVQSAIGFGADLGYAWLRRFHAPSSGVMVPSHGMADLLDQRGFRNLRRWSHGVDLTLFRPVPGADLKLPRPVWLHVGRLSYEKNLDDFLRLPLPGSKVVCGAGPLLPRLQATYPDVHWRGIVPRTQLPAIYSAADCFVFPGRSETFGLVMLEALACGTPVAAYPVAGPLDVVGNSAGGVLDGNLQRAALRALSLERRHARARALSFSWDAVCEQFLSFLVPIEKPFRTHAAQRHENVIKAS